MRTRSTAKAEKDDAIAISSDDDDGNSGEPSKKAPKQRASVLPTQQTFNAPAQGNSNVPTQAVSSAPPQRTSNVPTQGTSTAPTQRASSAPTHGVIDLTGNAAAKSKKTPSRTQANQIYTTMTEVEARQRYGSRQIPWEYEATAWRNWPDQGTITFGGQDFVFDGNHAKESGNYLFAALASLLTGTSEHHLLVRAEHARFWREYNDAMSEKSATSTNHETFTKLNVVPAKGAMMEQIGRAQVWQHSEVLELTALLYRVQVIVFDDSARPGNERERKTGHRPPNEVELRSFGPLNRTQLLLRFTGTDGGNHYQPMFADVERPEEYRYDGFDEDDVSSPWRYYRYRATHTQKGAASQVPLPFLWRPPPLLKMGDVSELERVAVLYQESSPAVFYTF